jgi:hypothetical protein
MANILIKNAKTISKIFSIGFILTLIGFLVFFALYANRGFEISDESNYLLWAMQPENVHGGISHFGHITKYIWFLSGGNIGNFRILSVVILFLSALIFAIFLDSFLTKKDHQESNISLKIIPIAALSLTGFIYFKSWLLSISYNLLNLVSCLLVMSGLFLVYGQNKNRTLIMILGGCIVGLAGFIAALSKPLTAFLLAIMVLIWITFFHQNNKKYYFLITAVTSALVPLLCFIYIKIGGASDFYKYISNNMHLAEIFRPNYELKSTFVSAYESYKNLLLFKAYYFWHAPVFILLFALLLLQRYKGYYNKYREKVIVFLSSFFLVALVFSFLESNSRMVFSFFTFSTISLVLTVITINRLDKVCKQELENFDAYIIVVLSLFVLPFAYSVGTSSNILHHSYSALIFLFAIWVYSFNILLKRNTYKIHINLLLSILMVIMTAKIINTAYSKPYRLITDIGIQDTDVQFLGVDGVIKVDKITAKYVNDLKEIAIKSGWKERNLLIDLKGGSPGALVILNAKLVGRPWLIGGYAGSANFVRAVIKLSGENPFDSWILTAPYGGRRVPVSVLSDEDYNFEENFQLVGEVMTGHRNELQLLWKPRKLKKYENN